MRSIIFTLALACSAFAGPTGLIEVQKNGGNVKPNSYIVTIKDGLSIQNVIKTFNDSSKVTHANWNIFNGFAATLTDAALQALRADPNVQSIEQDGVVTVNAVTKQTTAPWGLSRLSQNAKLQNQAPNALNFPYRYNSQAGTGVDIYIIDTGIYIQHTDFGGRAKWGATFGGYPNRDGHGHGTHVAGTAAGTRWGVAKKAKLIAVKVLGDNGSGYFSDVISGLNYVLNSAASSGRPTIASMSLGGSVSTALDTAVAKLTARGIHVTVAAGNSNANASGFSPARVPSAITVGATTIADARATFSNYGSVVDIFAPGVSITSAWITSTTSTNSISGTSMATPHIAGLVAYLISVNGNSSPAIMSTRIKNLSLKNKITGIPSGTLNYLSRNDITG